MFHVGDIVARFSHQEDIFFHVDQIHVNLAGEAKAILKGLNLRLLADAPISDLIAKSPVEVANYEREDNKMIYQKLNKLTSQRKVDLDDKSDFFEIPGRVLQVDGDQDYLSQCIKTYKQMGIQAKGICKSEIEQPKVIRKILQENPTDILVLTGHDAFIRGKKDFHSMDSYRSSRYFVESVLEARRFQHDRDTLVIFAGACQSNYEAILSAGANFASSPKRMLIHAFDPVFVVERIAFTPMDQIVSVKDILMHTITGTDGVGGIETRGQMRKGYPRSPY
ncbi:sporulation peptidase YabG [Desulfosporosinus fructosivorans]|uniref:Sporulation peptidase YabG n=1 Tax=Desulfosporosinus fructosivorans TaxID=2018669 RepID=A0A4Z0R2Z6_9FIRM|nr:sporulation peptidase YabG [Desulfosporosinus fructosivorans]TGE36493.1 sporulation peptidase YabG [Desulfosporosinus fructosivorans]